MKVNKAIYAYVSDAAAKETRLKAAMGEVTLNPADKLTTLFILSQNKDDEIRLAARETFKTLPQSVILEALKETLDLKVVKKIIETHPTDEIILSYIAQVRNLDNEVMILLASMAPKSVIEMIAKDREMLVRNPAILEAIRGNPNAEKSMPGDLAVIASPPAAVSPQAPHGETKTPRGGIFESLDEEIRSIVGEVGEKDASQFPEELIKEPIDQPADQPEKKIQREIPKNVYQKILDMTVSEKIKLAMLGNKEARTVLVKDSNKLVSSSVLKNPRITEDEIVKLTSTKGTPDDILRYIARNKEWLKIYKIKISLATNPKTPLAVSIRLLNDLHEKDIEHIAKSKNVSSVLASNARKILSVKKKH